MERSSAFPSMMLMLGLGTREVRRGGELESAGPRLRWPFMQPQAQVPEVSILEGWREREKKKKQIPAHKPQALRLAWGEGGKRGKERGGEAESLMETSDEVLGHVRGPCPSTCRGRAYI